MFIYTDARVRDLQTRFRAICEMVDAEYDAVRRFQPDHRSEVYKAILKSLAIEDKALVETGIALSLERYAGGDAQVYPMLHLPYDTNERGSWHRDDSIDNSRVFWIPLTLYKYPALSVIPWSAKALSFALAFAGSRLIDLNFMANKMNVAEQTYYAWSPRMLHRGNLNISDELSAALVIFVDSNAKRSQRSLSILTRDLVRDRIAAIKSGIEFDGRNQLDKVDITQLNSLPQPFRDNFCSFFQQRTKTDLKQWRPAQ